MRAGDVVRVDVGVPRGSQAASPRAAVVVTATEVLRQKPRTLQVVPITSTTRRLLASEVPLARRSADRGWAAQVHLLTAVAVDALTGETDEAGEAVSAAELAQIRETIADLLDIP